MNHNHTAAEVLEVIEEVNSPALNVILDTFHINIEESSLDGPVYLVNRRLGYVHVAENHRGLVGTGHLDLARVPGQPWPWAIRGTGRLLILAQAACISAPPLP